MRQPIITAAGLVLCLLTGCVSGPMRENPVPLSAQAGPACENPLYLPQGPASYGGIFEKVLDAVDDFFPIAYANRYGGEIQSHPTIAGGLFEPWKTSSPSLQLKLRATTQTIRHRAVVTIKPERAGGFFVEVRVLMELEDLPRPSRQTAGDATFLANSTVERQYEVVDQARTDNSWIPIGRDSALEQRILDRILEPDADRPWLNWLNAPTGKPAPEVQR